MPVIAIWAARAPSFATRPTSRKAKNLARNSHCVLMVAGQTLVLVVEGSATRVEGEADCRPMTVAFRTQYDWKLTLRDGAV